MSSIYIVHVVCAHAQCLCISCIKSHRVIAMHTTCYTICYILSLYTRSARAKCHYIHTPKVIETYTKCVYNKVNF